MLPSHDRRAPSIFSSSSCWTSGTTSVEPSSSNLVFKDIKRFSNSLSAAMSAAASMRAAMLEAVREWGEVSSVDEPGTAQGTTGMFAAQLKSAHARGIPRPCLFASVLTWHMGHLCRYILKPLFACICMDLDNAACCASKV